MKADIDDNKEVRDCLRAYKLNSQTKTLEASFKKFNKGVLIKTLIFLNVKNDISNYNRGKVVTELICRIQNLLLDECGMCGEQYATAMDEKLLLQCKLCGQNAHLKCLKTLLGEKFHDDLTSDCVSNLINPLKLDGLHYLCGSCSSSTIPSQDIGESHITKKLSTVNLDNEEQSGQHDKGLKNSPAHGDNDNSLHEGLGDLATHEEKDKPWRDRTDLCTLFLQAKCPHGITGKQCKNFHPHVCNRYRKNGNHHKYGCSKGNACTFYHPNICPNSLKSHRCLNNECGYRWHLPRTIRVANTQSRYLKSRHYSNNYSNNDRHYNPGRVHGSYPKWNSNNSNRQKYDYSKRTNYNNGYDNDIAYSNFTPLKSSYQAGAYQKGHSSGGDNWGSPAELDSRSRGCSTIGGGDNRHNRTQLDSNTDNTTGRFNNNFSPFLAQQLQVSIAQQVQAAFQHYNIPKQIQQELSKTSGSLKQRRKQPVTATKLSNSQTCQTTWRTKYQSTQNFYKTKLKRTQCCAPQSTITKKYKSLCFRIITNCNKLSIKVHKLNCIKLNIKAHQTSSHTNVKHTRF